MGLPSALPPLLPLSAARLAGCTNCKVNNSQSKSLGRIQIGCEGDSCEPWTERGAGGWLSTKIRTRDYARIGSWRCLCSPARCWNGGAFARSSFWSFWGWELRSREKIQDPAARDCDSTHASWDANTYDARTPHANNVPTRTRGTPEKDRADRQLGARRALAEAFSSWFPSARVVARRTTYRQPPATDRWRTPKKEKQKTNLLQSSTI
jgi:hypothetical protein